MCTDGIEGRHGIDSRLEWEPAYEALVDWGAVDSEARDRLVGSGGPRHPVMTEGRARRLLLEEAWRYWSLCGALALRADGDELALLTAQRRELGDVRHAAEGGGFWAAAEVALAMPARLAAPRHPDFVGHVAGTAALLLSLCE